MPHVPSMLSPKPPSDLNRGRIPERQLQWLCLSTKTSIQCNSACRVKDVVWARLPFSDGWSHAIFLDKRRSKIIDTKQYKLEQVSQHRERHVEMPFNRHCSSLKVRRTFHPLPRYGTWHGARQSCAFINKVWTEVGALCCGRRPPSMEMVQCNRSWALEPNMFNKW